jgi:hypothetical protein
MKPTPHELPGAPRIATFDTWEISWIVISSARCLREKSAPLLYEIDCGLPVPLLTNWQLETGNCSFSPFIR